MSKKIKLPHGKYATVDDEDYAVLSRLKWHSDPETECVLHCITGGSTFTVDMHYFLLPKKNSGDFRVVHLDGNNLNYSKNNLEHWRVGDKCHTNEKAENKSSKYKGVYLDYENVRWRAYISKNYKRIWLGSFKTEEEAALAYNIKSKELYGEIAYQNKI